MRGGESLGHLDNYKINQANLEEWSRYHDIYKSSNFNEWMSLSFQSGIERYKDLDFCYWV